MRVGSIGNHQHQGESPMPLFYTQIHIVSQDEAMCPQVKDAASEFLDRWSLMHLPHLHIYTHSHNVAKPLHLSRLLEAPLTQCQPAFGSVFVGHVDNTFKKEKRTLEASIEGTTDHSRGQKLIWSLAFCLWATNHFLID